MPAIFYQSSTTRREFLRRSTKGALVLAFAQSRVGLGQETGRKRNDLDLALLSDTHVAADPQDKYRDFSPSENLKAVVGQVLAAAPEQVIHCGDIARLTGEIADYEHAQRLISPLAQTIPVLMMLGNHDDRENFPKVFGQAMSERQPVKDKLVLVVEHPKMRFVLLDSLLYTNKVAGLLGKVQREWFEAFLQKSDGRPLIIFVHHTLGDGDGDLLDIDRLFGAVRTQRKVKAIFYGHSHEYAFTEEQGIHLVNLPAVGYNFKDSEPVGWVKARFSAEGSSLTLRALAGNRSQDGQTKILTWRT
jgi:3',5'-cyclic-AMP phosphodiesterase